MKKSIIKPDGSVEVIEGTPSEIAELEKKLRGEVQEAPKHSGPGLLTDDVQRLQEYVDGVGLNLHDPSCEMVQAQRGWFSIVPPGCTCGRILYPLIRRRYITTDKVGDVIPYPFTVT